VPFFNGQTGREEVWLWQESSEHELRGYAWTESYWFVTDIEAGGQVTKYILCADAERDYESRVQARVKDHAA